MLHESGSTLLVTQHGRGIDSASSTAAISTHLGFEVSMSTKFARLIYLAIASGLLSISCTAFSSNTPPTLDAPQPAEAFVAAVQQAVPLAELARPCIAIGSPAQTPAVARSSAEEAAGTIGLRGSADIAFLANVTIGTQNGRPATVANAQRDSQGAAIVDRPAWVLVYRHQNVRTPSGPIRGTEPAPRPVTVLAAIVDAQSGSLLRGWGCGR